MPTNHTPNYNLSQWERDDRVLMEDFNADNAKIDAALKGKADQSALNALSQTVNGHTSTLNRKGNCKVYFSTSTGTGGYGSTSPCTHTFPGRPLFVMIGAGDRVISAFQGVSTTVSHRGMETVSVALTWSGNSLSWAANNEMSQLNHKGTAYNIMALIATDA